MKEKGAFAPWVDNSLEAGLSLAKLPAGIACSVWTGIIKLNKYDIVEKVVIQCTNLYVGIAVMTISLSVTNRIQVHFIKFERDLAASICVNQL